MFTSETELPVLHVNGDNGTMFDVVLESIDGMERTAVVFEGYGSPRTMAIYESFDEALFALEVLKDSFIRLNMNVWLENPAV